ncbi:MAG: PKD domain-containing protein, partial [Gemmataceae bacterium]|nr:PKD domain-containing protein [Gemmataceae bacterium]
MNWGDGTPNTTFTTAAAGPISRPHTYADGPASFTATVTATDSLGASGTTTFTVNVNNVAPTLTLTGAATVAEGSPYSVTLSGSTDPGPDTPNSVVVHWGDGTTTPLPAAEVATLAAGQAVSVTHVFPDGPYTTSFSVVVTDEDGTFVGAPPVAVSVRNVAPTFAVSGATTAREGDLYTLTTGSVTGPGADTVDTYTVHWGAGQSDTYTAAQVAGAGGQVTHVYADVTASHPVAVDPADEDGAYLDRGTPLTANVAVRVADDDTGDGTSTFQVTVTTVAPTLTAVGPRNVRLGRPPTLAPLATFVDPNFGTGEVYPYAVNWGDGTATDRGTATVTTQGSPGVLTAGAINGSHTYRTEGTFTVSVTVTDLNGATATKSFQVRAGLPGLL